MKKSILLFAALLFLFPLVGTTFAGIPGATDKVLGASLLVPFFEVGIDKSQDPQDTLLVVVNTRATTTSTIDDHVSDIDPSAPPKPITSRIHYHVWDIDGNPTDLNGNAALVAFDTWAAMMGDLIAAASAATKSQLTDGTTGFYRGFVTIDSVSVFTALDPTNSSFPFENVNCLEGFIYYVRLLQGSSNGLDMIPLERVASGLSGYLNDFYQNGVGLREEIDAAARTCAQTLIEGGACTDDFETDRMDFRVFLDPAMSGGSRIIVFTWDPYYTEGPSIYCDTNPCASAYTYLRYDESGNEEEDTTIRLDHVVNVIDVSGTENGWVSIRDIADTGGTQVYGFSFNSASSSSMSTNWDAIFPAYIVP